MAIQNRQGAYKDFHPERMLPGEFAVVLSGDTNASSGRSLYICFGPGIVKRVTTYEDFERELQIATEEIQEAFTDDIKSAILSAVAATEAANRAVEAANAATKAANAAAEAAGAYVLGDISDKTVTFAEASERANVESGESAATLFGKVKKWFSGLKDAAFATIANNLTTTEAGSVLDARQGYELDQRLTQLNGKIPARYAGSASAGGSATSAVKLDTAAAGSATQPVYFSGGKPVACTYTLAKSVPANAVFTDTNTWRGVQNVLTSAAADQSLSANMGRVLNVSKACVHKTGWGTSLTIAPSGTGNLPHGIVMYVNHTVYGIWVAGNAGAFEVNATLLLGENALTFTCDRNTGTVTARAAGNTGIVYIGA